MEGLINVFKNKDSGIFRISPSLKQNFIYEIDITIDDIDNYENIITNTSAHKINELLNKTLKKINHSDYSFDKSFIKLIEEKDNLLNNNMVCLYLNQEETIKFMKKYNDIKIYGGNTINLNDSYLKKIEDNYNMYCHNLFYEIDGFHKLISYDYLKQLILFINGINNKLNSLNLSSLEEIMYMYDQVRNRVYNNDQDGIVCLGYSILFDKILKQRNYQSMIYSYQNKFKNKEGHTQNVIHIKDDKYNINGIYYFDITADSKQSDNDYSYLNSYRFFGLTKSQMSKIISYKYQDITFGSISNILNDLENNSISIDNIKYLNNISLLIDNKDITINNMNKTLKKLKKYLLLFNNKIDINILYKVLKEVRLIEYQEDNNISNDISNIKYRIKTLNM